MRVCKTLRMTCLYVIATAFLLINGNSIAATITAQDIVDQAGITNDFGVQSITIGDFTIETIESVNLSSSNAATLAIGTAEEKYSNFEGSSGLRVSFDAPVYITSLSFGLHGNSDGNLLISGFSSNPNASSTFGTPSFAGDTLTLAPNGFIASYDITLTNQVSVSSLTFTTSTTGNDGVGFLGITYEVAPPSAPTAVDDTVSTSYQTATNIFVLVNDLGTGLGIESVDSTATNASGQAKGSVAYTPGNDYVTCTPTIGFSGDLYFSYVVTNSSGSDTGLVTVAVAVDQSTVTQILADDFTGVSKTNNVATITAWDTADGVVAGTSFTALNDGGTAADYFNVRAGELDPNASVHAPNDGWDVSFGVTIDADTVGIALTSLELTSWAMNSSGITRTTTGGHAWTLSITGDGAYGTQSASGDAIYGGGSTASVVIDLSGLDSLVAGENYTFKLGVREASVGSDSTYAALDDISLAGVRTRKYADTVIIIK
jgi:hypothetical protein